MHMPKVDPEVSTLHERCLLLYEQAMPATKPQVSAVPASIALLASPIVGMTRSYRQAQTNNTSPSANNSKLTTPAPVKHARQSA